MSIVQKRLQPCSARLSANGEKIILGPGPAAWTEFCQSLPAARWNQLACSWTCDATPAAAWRIACFGQTDHAYVSAEIHKTAADFAVRIRCAREAAAGEAIEFPLLFKTPAWKHQGVAWAFAHPLDASLLAMGMGTGKSKVACDLFVNWSCQTVLILCPASVRGVWRR